MDLPEFRDPDALPRIVSRADAVALGMSPDAIDRRVAAGKWRRLLPRTYLTTNSCTDVDRLYAAVAYAGRGAALSGAAGLTAAGVRGIAVPSRILVLVPPTTATQSTAGVLVRRTSRPIVARQWYGPRHVEPARAAADLAVTMRRLDDVRTLVARVVQGGHGTLPELAAELESGPRRGSAHLRQALTEIGWGAESAPEAQAARLLRRARITGFVQNAELCLPDGSTRRVDFLWPALRACLEIDSVEYHFAVDHWRGTWDRHLDLSKFGYSVIHRPPSALRDEARFVRDVADWLAAREADLRRGLDLPGR